MNILFVTGVFAENKWDTALGGMANAVYKSAIGMQQRGHRVRVLTVDDIDRRWCYQGSEVISVKAEHGLEKRRLINNLFCILKREFRLEHKIALLHKEENIDIIQYTGWFGVGLFHFSKIPSIMRISSYTKIQLINNYSKPQRQLIEEIEYRAAKRMNFIFAPSNIMAAAVQKDIKKTVRVIETPFYQEKIEWDSGVIEKKLSDKKYILYFGRMSVDKGIFVIRDVLYRVLDQYPDRYFVFAGDSWKHEGVEIEKELRSVSGQYKKRLIFLGQLPKKKLLPVINNAEMVLIPSLADNFPNSCAEAMALGKIVIGSDGSSLEQFICDRDNGLLAKIGDAESLYGCIEYVINMSESQKEDMSVKARRRIRALNLEDYSFKMESLYKRVINKAI